MADFAPIQVYNTGDKTLTGYGGRFIVRNRNVFRYKSAYGGNNGQTITWRCSWKCGPATCSASLVTNANFEVLKEANADKHCHERLTPPELKAKIALATLKTDTMVSELATGFLNKTTIT